MLMAELARPQLARVPMCPPHARTASEAAMLNEIVICVELSPAYEPDSVYALTPVRLPPNSVNTPEIWANGTFVSWGMATVVKVARLHPVTPEHGLLPALALRSQVVR